ncbi:MAG TPA: Hsp20/alpha crystallin family protein [Clostridiaceae bacterium]|nr:Hsp20/alpha crystallin family protein [Clostridiaceae bacterium]
MFYLTPFRRSRSSLVRENNWFDMDKLFEDFFSDSYFPVFLPGSNAIRADIRETDKEYIIEAEVPGVSKDNIKIDLRDDVLTIAVDYNEETKIEEKGYIRKERRSGSFCRSFHVDNIKHEEVKAKYNDGILTIVLPKKEEGRRNGRTIEIQ